MGTLQKESSYKGLSSDLFSLLRISFPLFSAKQKIFFLISLKKYFFFSTKNLKTLEKKKRVMTFCESQSWWNIAPRRTAVWKRNLGDIKVCIWRKSFLVNCFSSGRNFCPYGPIIFEKTRICIKVTIFLA